MRISTPRSLESLLTQAYSQRAFQCQFGSRQYATATKPPAPRARDVAIVGAGITGLTTAYRLTKLSPQTKVTIYEASPRVGGWMQSKYVDVGNGDKVLFELGPHSLRPNRDSSLLVERLLDELGLLAKIRAVSKTDPSALYRYIYDGTEIMQLPNFRHDPLLPALQKIVSNDLLWGSVSGALTEVFRSKPRLPTFDESVEDFLMRRTNSRELCNLASAMLHGIYAGDIGRLSARTLLKSLFLSEAAYGSITLGMLLRNDGNRLRVDGLDRLHKEVLHLQAADNNFTGIGPNVSTYTFQKGVEQLPSQLEASLSKNPNVTIKKSARVSSIKKASSDDLVQLQAEGSPTPKSHNTVVWTVSGRGLYEAANLGDEIHFGQGRESHSIGVVNLCYPHTEMPLYPPGFGYLLPRSVPFDSNPELALGVIFGPAAISEQERQSGKPHQQLKVMLGGHWWNDFEELPEPEELLKMAKSVLRRQLGITIEPIAHHSSIHKNAIPQYYVGHSAYMGSLRARLGDLFDGKLRVAGSHYTGISINDCIAAGMCTAREIVDPEGGSLTGLEGFRLPSGLTVFIS